jgi:hypothetical protein
METKMANKKYSELRRFATIEERYEYLKMNRRVGEATFGYDRYLNQTFYRSKRWRDTRDNVILRDNGCDLGIPKHEIVGKIMIHHMQPITPEQILNDDPELYNPEYLICSSEMTHEAIHFGDDTLLPKDPVIRRPNDMIPWK